MSEQCKRCRGSGEVAGGVCFSCQGSGSVDDIAYKTTPARESTHPALRAEREQIQDSPGYNATPEVVERCLAEMKAMLPSEQEAPQEPERITPCDEHRFGDYGACVRCGVFEHQLYQLTLTEVERREFTPY